MKKFLAAAALAAGVVAGTAACGPAYPTAQYCVDQFGQVEPAYYCNGSGLYAGHQYYLFVGSVGGRSYNPGQRIPGSYFNGGTRVNPGNGAARAKAGLPFSGSVRNGGTVAPKPASPGVSPGFSGGSKGGSSTTTRTGGTFGGSSRSGGFSSGGSRSGSFSVGGRK